MQRMRKAFRFFKRFGFKAFSSRIYAEYLKIQSDREKKKANKGPVELEKVLQKRFTAIQPLRAFSSNEPPGRRLNLITDSINSSSLFGGVATSLIFSTLLADCWKCDLRIITRTQAPEKENYYRVLEPNQIPLPENVEFLFNYFLDPSSEIPVKEGDVFLTTSWWTTWGARETFGSNKLIYLLQEDERSFYPFGDDHLRCTELMRDPNLQIVINTQMLYQYLISEGFENLQLNGCWFEPSWPQNIFFYENDRQKEKKNFFFYARPNNLRNLFYRGVEAIEQSVISGILDPNEWDFYFVGKEIPNIRIQSFQPKCYQGLSWSDYAGLVRKMDLGLSLMYTPHPSYPPLDLAASGAVVVTNRFGPKQDLDCYSKNILCCDVDVESLVHGIQKGVDLVGNAEERMSNYQKNGILHNWRDSFEAILQRFERWPSDVRH